MILPRNRLLLWVAIIVLPFSILGAAEPTAAGVSLGILTGLVALAVADALSARDRLAGINVELPAVARMSRDREAQLELRIKNVSQAPRTVRVALALPREIQSAQEDALVALP